MKAFKLFGDGRLAKNPELVKSGDRFRCRFTLIGNEYAGKDDETGEAKEKTVAIHVVAFGAIAEAIGKHARKGDQLIIEGHIGNNNWEDKEGEKQYDYDFVVDGFRFGAPGSESRERLNKQAK